MLDSCGTTTSCTMTYGRVQWRLSAPEGRLLIRRHKSRERDKGLRKRKIDAVLRQGRRLACEACDFDFEATYGPRGAGYIECHHVVPLHEAGEGRTRLSDLALICANCHRMIHRRAPWPTPGELRTSSRGQRTGQPPNRPHRVPGQRWAAGPSVGRPRAANDDR
ncbi:hypothetical protein GCM10011428_73280 [Streptomyces violaceus]